MFEGASFRRFAASLLFASVLVFSVLSTAPGGGPAARAQSGAGPVTVNEALALSGQLTRAMMEGRFQDVVNRLGPAIAGALSSDELGAIWASLQLQMGALRDVGEPWVAGTEPLILVRAPLHFEAATLDLVFGFDADLLLGTLVFVPHEPRPQTAPAVEPAAEGVAGQDSPAADEPGGPGSGGGRADDETGPAESRNDRQTPPGSQQASEVPPYADPSLFIEYELTFGLPEFPLGGTLTVPKGEGPFPVVVLVHGSGPQDRDETTLLNKPFRDMAWGLASRGVAVFRYDKRTFAHAETAAADPNFTVYDETVADAVEAVRMLRTRDDINRIYVAGHSQGGMLAPYIALEEPSIDGLILRAANARSIGELTLAQIDYLLSGYAAPGSEAALKAMRPEAERLAAGDLEGVETLLGVPAGYWIDLQNRDHTGAAAGLPQPMLILQGGRDYQVTVTDFEMWREVLAHKDNVTYRLYPALNHLFMPGEGPGTPMEYARPGFVAEEVVGDIAAWIHSLR